MESKSILRLFFTIVITISVMVTQVFAQGNNYKLDGNANGTPNSVIGFKNAADLKIITNDTLRQTVTKDGDVIIEKTLTVKGGITSDSVVHISAHTVIDSSLRVRGGLIVGDSSLYLDDNVNVFPIPPHDRIRSSQGKISFMQGSNTTYICGFTFFPKFKPLYCTTKTATSDILMGIGTESPKSRLDVLGGVAIGTYAGVNTAPNNGLIVSGNTGIGTNNPTATLEVANASTTQFKITDHLATSSNQTAAFTWFRVTPDGDITIQPFHGTGPNASALSSRFMGINTGVPKSVLHINDGIGGGGKAYLQITATGSILPIATNGFKIGINGTVAELRQQENAALNFYTYNALRITILGGILGGATTGFVGIGTPTPTSLFHINDNNGVAIYTQITNLATGSSANNGLKIGIANDGTAELRQQKNKPMTFYTNDGTSTLERVRILANGNVGVGTITPPSLLSVGTSNPFQVNSSGDMVKIKNITYSWPTAQGAANTFLRNNGSGGLSWVTIPTSAGATGSTGATGNTGATGANGINGINGTNGINGSTGSTGATGTNGTNGTNGSVGSTGAIGATGTNGTNGTNGTDGNTGATGTNGINGTNGTDGSTGATGTNGINGTNGTDGSTGATGTNGTNGTNGTDGSTGATGATWTIESNDFDANGKLSIVTSIPSTIISTNAAWLTTGNTNTVDAYPSNLSGNFIGTIDNVPFNIRVGNENAGRIDQLLENTFLGFRACNLNTIGTGNTAIGSKVLYSNVQGVNNTAVGTQALYNMGLYNLGFPSESYNTAVGVGAGSTDYYGSNNTYIGAGAGSSGSPSLVTVIGRGARVNGSNSTAVGAGAQVLSGYTNSSAIGYNAIAFGSDGEMLGSSTASVGVRAWGPYLAYSDGRFKTDITENVKGLEFIKKLRPITYQMDTKKADDFTIQNMSDSLKTEHQNGMDFAPSSAIVRSGFIAQEVEQAALDVGFTSSIVHAPSNNADLYGLAYAEFVVPLVKAVQELDSTLTSVSNKGVITSGTPLLNSLTKFTDSTTIANSQIVDDGINVGINTNNPNNKLEINSDVANTSGLTFTNLTLASSADSANGKVLSVNSSGAVILTYGTVGATGATGATGAIGVTGAVGATGATGATGASGADGSLNSWALTGSSGTDDGTNFIGTTDNVPFNIRVNNQKAGRIDQTKLNTFFGYLAGNSNSAGSPGLGSNNTAIGNRALYSNFEGNYNTAIGESALLNTTGYGNTGIGNAALYSNNAGVLNVAIGWEALVGNTSGGNNTAIGNFSGQSNMTGSYNTFLGYSAGSSVQSGLINATAIGANARVTASNSLVLGNAANVGIGISAPAYKLDVNGDVNVNGTYHQNGNVFTSDQQFKTDVDSISNAVALIKQLKPRSFNFDTTNVYGLNFNDQKQYGLIAQDVEQILPELVSNTTKTATYDTSGTLLTPTVTYKSLNYTAFTAITLKAIQELSNENDSLSEGLLAEKTKTHIQDSINTSLQNQLNQMMTAINSCCKKSHEDRSLQLPEDTGQSSTKQTDVELSNKNVVVLDQNVPNPFAEQTTINYYLPENVKRAQILFFEQSGKIIKTVDLTEKGKGVLNVFANDLSNGIYTYSLIVDGQIVETKKMVKQ